MKKILLSLVATFVLAVGLIGCSSNSPKASADKFLTSLYHMDYKEAKTVSTEETKKILDMMEQFSSMMPDSAKETAKKIKVDIKDVKEDGDKATVMYTTSESPNEQKLDLVKQNGKWLVQWSKQDGGAGAEDMSNEPVTDEPMMNDSTAMPMPPAEGAPTAADTAMAK